MTLERLADHPRVTVRHRAAPDSDGTAVVYWMQRAQRAVDNPALDLAIEIGNRLGKPVVVFFGLNPFVERANRRHYRFLADGLRDIATGLRKRRVGFVLRRYPHHRLQPWLAEIRPAMVVGDENPLRQTERWREQIGDEIAVPLWTVDADVVVPAALIEKEQYAARTIRPRLHRHLKKYLVAGSDPAARVRWRGADDPHAAPASAAILDDLPIDDAAAAVDLEGGTSAGRRQLRRFIDRALDAYDDARNHPEVDGTSRLSPYLHFGHLGPREVALAVRASGARRAAIDAFLEQLIVRRELAVNFVRFNDAYDRLEGCERWARNTLAQHRRDTRAHVYTLDQFAAAATHDPLWNAAQRQMVVCGWMHNYVRMYWGKKILEWTRDPAEAFAIAVTLNDRYEIDGRDPNGYANIAWAIGGKHDRPWPPRPVYGTIRSMSFASTAKKFDTDAYIGTWSG